MSGCTDKEKGKLGLHGKPEDFYYLNQSGVYTVEETDDREDYVAMRVAMTVVGLDSNKQQTILQLVSAILLIGNIKFCEKKDVAHPVDAKMLDFPARLLSVNKENLQEKLTSSIMETRWGGRVEITKKTNNADQAVAARDALAKALYSQLFDYLVQVTNDAMQKEQENLCIGVLDIYGFEIFKQNSFEQFAINYVNEKLQQVFVELTLKMEQEEYVREGISWERVDYSNNRVVCELIESKRPPGIMGVLDDACSTMHAVTEGAEKTFMKKLSVTVGSNKTYSSLFQAQADYFTIKHYAGNVVYEAKGFCEKNKDVLSNDMVTLMQSSDNPFVRDLFPDTVYAEGGGRRGKSNTGSTKIKSQANALIGKIMGCTPHYIRCIKPSESKLPLDWDQQRVLSQIVYLGLKENILVRRSGFAIRREFDSIVKGYGIIARETKQRWTGDQAEGCRFILHAAGLHPSKWKIGKTKLFLKEPDALRDLENKKNKLLTKFCVTIQKNYRCYYQRKRYKMMRKAAVVIQRVYRSTTKRKVRRERANSFAVWSGSKRLRLGTLADIVAQTMGSKRDPRRPDPCSFTAVAKAIFGPSGGGVHCKGIALDIPDGSLTTPVKEICLQVCKCKEDIVPLNEGEHIVSGLVAVGPNRDPLTAPVKLYLPLQDSCAADLLLLRWTPSQVGEAVTWKDVLPGACTAGRFTGGTARLQISGQQSKITTNSFGLFCIISRNPVSDDIQESNEGESKTGFLMRGLSEVINRVSRRGHSVQSHDQHEASEQLALIQ